MNKKIIGVTILSGLLFAAEIPKRPADVIGFNPLNASSRSVDSAGAKSAIDAYSDGAGVLMVSSPSDTKIDNSATNTLVFKYGEAAKANNVSLSQQVLTISSGTSTVREKLLAGLTNNLPASQSIQCNGVVLGSYCWTSTTAAAATIGYTCQSGGTLQGTVCDAGSACPGGYTYNTGNGLCEIQVSSYTYIASLNSTYGNPCYCHSGGTIFYPQGSWAYCTNVICTVSTMTTAGPTCPSTFTNSAGVCSKPATMDTTYSCVSPMQTGGNLGYGLNVDNCYSQIQPCPAGTSLANPDSRTNIAICARN